MFSSKVVFAVVASIALASAAPGLLDSLPIIGGGNGGVGGLIGGGQGGSGGLLGGLIGGLLGGEGGLLGGLLEGNGLGNLLDGVLGNGTLSGLLRQLLTDLLTLVKNLLQNLQQVIGGLPEVLENLTGILGQDTSITEKATALKELNAQNPLELNTLLFIVNELSKNQGGNGGAVSVPTPQTPQIPVFEAQSLKTATIRVNKSVDFLEFWKHSLKCVKKCLISSKRNMFDYQTSIYRKRLKSFYAAPVLILLSITGSFLFMGYEDATSEEIKQFEGKYSRDFRRISRDSDIGDVDKCVDSLPTRFDRSCPNFCENLKEKLMKSQNGGFPFEFINSILLGLLLFLVVIDIAYALIKNCCCKSKPKEKMITDTPRPLPHDSVVSTPVPPEKSASMPQETSGDLHSESTADNKIEEAQELKHNDAVNKMRTRLLAEHKKRQKLKDHVDKKKKQHKSDTRSTKFRNEGPIFIPREPNIPPASVLPNDIVLNKVEYDPSGNEMYEIGSDVDEVELEPSVSINSESSASRTAKKTKLTITEEKLSTVEQEAKARMETKKKSAEKVEKKVEAKVEKAGNVQKTEQVKQKEETVKKPEEEKKTKSEEPIKPDDKSKKSKKSIEKSYKNSKEENSKKSKRSKRSHESTKSKDETI
ncbi:unnamed protein product [Caenorhabditis brenneri]